LPEFECFEGFEEGVAAVFVGVGFSLKGVEFGVARVCEEGFCHGNGGGSVSEVGEVAGEPLVVVSVVVDLVRNEEVFRHMGVVDAGGGLLLPSCVGVAVELGVDVAGHMPHMGDGGGGATELGGGGECFFGTAVVPEVNGVVMGGVEGGFGEDLFEEGVEAHMAADGDAFLAHLPVSADKEGFGFEVFGVVEDDVFEVLEEFFTAFFDVFGIVVVEAGLGLDVGFLSVGDFSCFDELGGAFDEGLGPFFVFPVGHGESPVGHGAVGIVCEEFAEGSLGFVVPESVKLADSLVEVVLSLVPGGGDGEVDFAGSFHERASLAGAFVEGVALMGVAFFDGLFSVGDEGESD